MYIWYYQDSNPQPVQSQAWADSTRPHWQIAFENPEGTVNEDRPHQEGEMGEKWPGPPTLKNLKEPHLLKFY